MIAQCCIGPSKGLIGALLSFNCLTVVLFKWKLCFGKWSSQWESTAGSDLEQSHADYNKEITQIRFDITKSFMQKGIPFPLLLSPECPGPQVAACPCFEQLIWHWKSTICKDNINLIKRVGCGKARIGTILKRQVPCVAQRSCADDDDRAFKKTECVFSNCSLLIESH